MELDKMQEVEYLKRDLHALEREEKELLAQLEKLRGQKNSLLEQIAKSTDSQYEQDALTKLYEQRRRK